MRRFILSGFLILIMAVCACEVQAIDVKKTMETLLGQAGSFSPYVDEKGSIKLPEGYRAQWVHLGSWVVPNEKAPGYGFHDVYTQPESLEAFCSTGSFPDGAVLVKEIRSVKTADLTTGTASWAGDPAVWFVMVKDSKNRFAASPLWGEGWGWALFKAGDPGTNAATSYQKDCIPCHMPVKDTDWVYLQGYPTLR